MAAMQEDVSVADLPRPLRDPRQRTLIVARTSFSVCLPAKPSPSAAHLTGLSGLIGAVKSFFIPLVCLGMLLSGLLHLLFPDEAEKRMSCPRNVRIVGAILLGLIFPAAVWGFYALAILLLIFGLPRLFTPRLSIRLQRLSYPRRMHGVLLVMGAVGLWILSRLTHR